MLDFGAEAVEKLVVLVMGGGCGGVGDLVGVAKGVSESLIGGKVELDEGHVYFFVEGD